MIKIFKIASVLLIAVLIFLLACSKKKPSEPEPSKYKWTILGYFDGNNSQDQTNEGDSYVIKDLQELEQIDSTEEVQVLVMLGSFKTDGNCKYYHVKPDSSEEVLDLGKKDMSDYTTLRDFIGYGVHNYPAEHYMLIINDHGRGWKGVCSDTINGAGNWMSLPNLSSALSGFKFDIILFYTPSMATAEVAYQIRDKAEYMIASQFNCYPENILGSSGWLSYLTDSPSINARLFARIVTEEIYNASTKHVHSVLIHLPKISKVATDISNLGRDLIDSTGSYWTEVWEAWEASHQYDIVDSAFVDLQEFARQIREKTNLSLVIRDDAEDLDSSVNKAVILQYKYPKYPKIGGISIHLPWDQDSFDSTNYAQLDFVTIGWHSFISTFIKSFSGNYAGALNISSKPTGARVFLNGVDTGDTTNVVIGGLLPGDYTIKQVKAGYADCIWQNVPVYSQQTTKVHCDF